LDSALGPEVINQMMNAYHELEQHLGRRPRDEEMAEQLGVRRWTNFTVCSSSQPACRSSASMWQWIPKNKRRDILSCIVDPKSTNAFGVLGLNEVKDSVARAIEDLPEKEKRSHIALLL